MFLHIAQASNHDIKENKLFFYFHSCLLPKHVLLILWMSTKVATSQFENKTQACTCTQQNIIIIIILCIIARW